MKKKTTTYNLCSTERRFKNETLISYYFQSNKKIIKKHSPIDINGERYRLDLETGEISTYSKKDILDSYAASLRRTRIAMNLLLSMNDFDWFWTLTFDKDKVERENDQVVFDCYEKYINNAKHQFPTFKYMCFPERHEDGCIHFHLLVAGLTPKQMGLVNSGKVCCSWATKKSGIANKKYFDKTKEFYKDHLKETDGEPIYNITTFTYGYTTASRICSRERCNSYVKKYVEKALGSTEIFKKRFYYSSNLNVPNVVKRIIGADFESPQQIDKLLQNDNFVKNADGIYKNEDYNVLQVKINNTTKDLLDRGFVPFSKHDLIEQINLEDIF